MKPTICLVGLVVVDVLQLKSGPIVRLGGIFHAAKALSAFGCDFEIAYVAPSYLDHEIASYARQLGASKVMKVGDVEGCPNVLLVGEPTEAGSQGYEFILDSQRRCCLNLSEFEFRLREKVFTDVIIFPGGFALGGILSALKRMDVCVHVDANFDPKKFSDFRELGRPLQTLILSTSSNTFLEDFKGDCAKICTAGLKYAQAFILKENRGGCRYFRRHSAIAINIPAFPRKISHSVGVGDCFNSVYVYLSRSLSCRSALSYASLIAGEYASVLDFSLFREAVERTMKIPSAEVVKLRGVSLPWELRQKCHIYIAAPDFQAVNISQLERIVECLKYHNFVPRRPVLENGEITEKSNTNERSATALADIKLLGKCQILLAVLLYDDPGTYIEMGMAHEKGMPVIVYAPNRITSNLLTDELPILISSDLDEVITEVFKQAAILYGN
jgi:nucleoside 2-deoxyribosyltransferase